LAIIDRCNAQNWQETFKTFDQGRENSHHTASCSLTQPHRIINKTLEGLRRPYFYTINVYTPNEF
jgi:hypothetical protein